jgi:hypothetical protein
LTIDTILPAQRIRRRVGGRGIVETDQLDGLLDNLDEVSYRQALVGYSNASAGRSKTRRIRSATTPSGRSATSITQPTRGSTAIAPPSASSELREEERRRP